MLEQAFTAAKYNPNTVFDHQEYQNAGATNTEVSLFGQPALGMDMTCPTLIQYRMTSPYNIMKQMIITNNNAATPASNSYTSETAQPTWLEMFDTKYQYYHIIETEWELTINIGQPNNGTNSWTNQPSICFYIFWRYTNEDDPPVQASVATSKYINTVAYASAADTGATIINPTNLASNVGARTGGSTPNVVNLNSDDYFRMGGWKHKHIVYDTTRPTRATIRGKYEFGQCKMDVSIVTGKQIGRAHV